MPHDPLPVSKPEFLTPKQVADRFQVPVSAVRRLAREGQIDAVKIGRFVRIRAAEIERQFNGGHAT